MTTWHQRKAGTPDVTKTKGYALRSDGYNQHATVMSFGDGEEARERAFDSLEKHRKNQPTLHHYLYHNGRLIA